ncbi:PKD domain-containing protein [Candidatus Acetothermia bacterium]|nr:PKD domain-containing protein [Candidatus Acetothermia bacterium]MBI3459902.1 PKD domain-containing protein [Candidatus Acetothermia bacterium]MBI3660681.1 PKD domain-containing protein [Candidatus Acetothermia bacterium]
MSQRVLLSLLIIVLFGLAGCTQTTPPPPPSKNEPPTAKFEATPTEGFAPLTVQFDASKSVDSDGKIANYAWDFGDTATDSGAERVKVSHTYPTPGQYKAKLTVKDDKGAEDNFDLTISVKEKEKPAPQPITDKTENDYVVLERTYPSEAKAGEAFSITVKATAKQNLAGLLVREGDEKKGLPPALKLISGNLADIKTSVQKGESVQINYTVSATQEGKVELRGVAKFVTANGQTFDLPMASSLTVVK